MDKRNGDDHKEEKNCKMMKWEGHSLRMRRMVEEEEGDKVEGENK